MADRDLFGNEIEIPEEEVIEKSYKATPFEFIRSINDKKTNMMKDNSDAESQYSAYIVNRGLGYFPDTVMHANEMNRYPEIPGKAQYYYYMYAIRKGYRSSKWFKREDDPNLEAIKEVYQVRSDVAKQYLAVLSEDDLKIIRDMVAQPETISKSKKKKNK